MTSNREDRAGYGRKHLTQATLLMLWTARGVRHQAQITWDAFERLKDTCFTEKIKLRMA